MKKAIDRVLMAGEEDPRNGATGNGPAWAGRDRDRAQLECFLPSRGIPATLLKGGLGFFYSLNFCPNIDV